MSPTTPSTPTTPATLAGPAKKLSPAMAQHERFKRQHPGYVLFFRMGDFYELFGDDAKLAASTLGIALTARQDRIPMAGVPYHQLDNYLKRMILAGHRVAICDQVENAKQAKGLVKRDVTRLVTPGTLTDESLLETKAGNYLAAVGFGKGTGLVGLAWAELSTGRLTAMAGPESEVLDEAARLGAAEVLVPETPGGEEHPVAHLLRRRGLEAVESRPAWQFGPRHAMDELARHWGVSTARGFGFEDDDPAVIAVGAVLTYLDETQRDRVAHLRPPARHDPGRHLRIDPASYRSLEIDRTLRNNATDGSLVHAIDRTRTPMGGRLLREWLRSPLAEVGPIVDRQDAVAALKQDAARLRKLREALGDACDVERVVGRLAVNRGSPRDLAALRACLASMPALLELLAGVPAAAGELPELADFCAGRAAFLKKAIAPEPPGNLRDGNVIARGFDAELDGLRDIGRDGKTWLAEYQGRLSAENDIPSLKLGFNKVFGYYVEVSNAHKHKAPDGWSRRQSTKNAERFVTEELKTFEERALGAEGKAAELEQRLFEQVRNDLLPHVARFQAVAAGLARADVLSALAALSLERGYCRPAIVSDRVLRIDDGKHPVLEQTLGADFVANGVGFAETDTLKLITGPNMAGKSTFIRQTALLVLLAQVGSDVPAQSATVGVCDRLFTRVGASDELHAGQSTFMVEMTEAANLLNNATDRSLVILDEIGRGTSTLDGLSLAWAIAEHVAKRVGCRCLFATHYHELTRLGDDLPGVANLNVAVREWDGGIVFQHRIVDGAASQSYGIQVAKLAGVPTSVTDRAAELLQQLRVDHAGDPAPAPPASGGQLALFGDAIPPGLEAIRDELERLDPDDLTPRQAHELLEKLKARL
jgi:DNA mismatch repair protein MutS